MITGDVRDPGFDPWVRKKEIATHSCILAWKIPWMVEPGGLFHGFAKNRTQLSVRACRTFPNMRSCSCIPSLFEYTFSAFSSVFSKSMAIPSLSPSLDLHFPNLYMWLCTKDYSLFLFISLKIVLIHFIPSCVI